MGLPENYRDQIIKLLPRGPIWSFGPGSFGFKFIHAISDELARVHVRAQDLTRERDPRRASELLQEYEEMLGLPGDCAEISDNLFDRRAAIVAKTVSDGGQSKQYFVDVAAQAGINITISMVEPMYIGFELGSEFTNGPWLYTWTIFTPDASLDYADVATAEMGDALVEVSSQQTLECLFEDIKPAHTYIVYTYGT